MSLDSIIEYVQKRIEKALEGKLNEDEQVEAIIWTCVAINAGMGVAPFGLNILSFMTVASVMVAAIGNIYGCFVNHEEAGKVIKTIILSAGWVYAANLLGWKVIIELAKVLGVGTAGAVTAIAMTIDGVLFGAVTYSIGYTSKVYFKKGKKMSKEELSNFFKSYIEIGKEELKKRK